MKTNENGLNEEQVQEQREKYGWNRLEEKQKVPFYLKVIQIVMEPMFLLLVVAALIYFFLGEPVDGTMMFLFVVVIIAIEVLQEWKTDQTLEALKELSAPKVKVIREGKKVAINSEELVPEDLMWIEEGVKIPADGFVLKANDLRINESSLTGEAEAVWKKPFLAEAHLLKEDGRQDYVYAGTLVTTGSGLILIDKIGSQTEYGKIGQHLALDEELKSPLSQQMAKLVRTCATIAFLLFSLVAFVTFFNTAASSPVDRVIQSILSGITIAMAMIPEEFPVVLTVFLSMGAWRLAKKQSLVRKLSTVETMGAVSVLAVDKTGTVTENKMTVTDTWFVEETAFLETLVLACETNPYDSMEIGILAYTKKKGCEHEVLFEHPLLLEYPFTDELKMMGHVWQQGDQQIIAVKGSPESVLRLSQLSEQEQARIEEEMTRMAAEGLRVLAVGRQEVAAQVELPQNIEACRLQFLGLVGLSDPPRQGIKEEILACQKAGIKVVMITGDNGVTANAIAKKVGIQTASQPITGAQLDTWSKETLAEKVKDVTIFSRVTPEHKKTIVRAFQENGEIVAMTGDGVNDAPALKAADIGIAMGKRGSEVSKEAADIILLDDQFSTIRTTIRDGRRIYDNIKKAIGYILVIHIPIALTALLGPLLGIPQMALFLLPTHVVLLELVIDPTCSIVLERQPSESDIMERPPRNPKEKILTTKLLVKSLVQGLVIFIASFGSYLLTLQQNPTNANIARTIGLTVLIIANLFLVQVNSSEHRLAIQTFFWLIRDKVVWAVLGATLFLLLGLIYSPMNDFLGLAPLTLQQLLLSSFIGMVSVCWYDLFKRISRK